MELRGSDLRVVAEQLGREPVTEFSVAARCSPGHPLVIKNRPLDRDGVPFPTLFWLTCPHAVRAVSRVEADGWIKRLAERASDDADLGAALRRAHHEYATERGRMVAGAEAWGGVAGSRAGVKCLHAHYAYHLAGGDDPIGAWVARRVAPVHPDADAAPRVAAIDVGTNSVRLLVAESRAGELAEIARDLVITRLGSGVDATRRFDPSALRRTVEAIERYVRRARALGARDLRVAATSAVRDVADRSALEVEVARIVGSPAEVLSGEREGELTFLGATAGLEVSRPILVFDIGGGSTELVVGGSSSGTAISVDIGSVRLTERVKPRDPPSREDLEEMRRLAADALVPGLDAVAGDRPATLVGVAGTTTTVQALALRLDRYDPEAIHRSVLSRSDAEQVAETLARMTVAERRALPVMTPGREDVIVAGCAILLELLRGTGSEHCLVSERDILDGLALEMLRRQP